LALVNVRERWVCVRNRAADGSSVAQFEAPFNAVDFLAQTIDLSLQVGDNFGVLHLVAADRQDSGVSVVLTNLEFLHVTAQADDRLVDTAEIHKD
jgi:hypothetical protein